MSYTTDSQRATAKLIAERITAEAIPFGVSECIVDDFGRYGNFSLICYLRLDRDNKPLQAELKTFNLSKVGSIIKRVISEYRPQGARLRAYYSPKRVYRSNSCHGMRLPSDFDGYEQSYTTIDLDFYYYHEQSNTFGGLPEKENVAVVLENDNQLKLKL